MSTTESAPTTRRPVALVTGASSGIGQSFARRLARGGHDLVLVARDASRLEALAKELDAQCSAASEVLSADLTDATQLARVEARLRAEPAIDVLINNAGFGSYGNFHELDVDVEAREVQLNVTALVRLTHAALGPMVARGSGSVLNVASVAAFQPVPGDATYAATKAFVLSFTEAVHEELRGTGVHMTVLAPGFTRTEFQERADYDASNVPGFMWQEADEVVEAALAALAKNRAVCVPGVLNRVTATLSGITPHVITRRVSGKVGRSL
jgi:short-subunit dehydrogenase